MTATVTPGIATTGAGTTLPLIALPQDQILTVSANKTVDFALSKI